MEDSLDNYLDCDAEELVQRYETMMEENKSVFFDVDEYLAIIETYLLISDLSKAQIALKRAQQQYPTALELKLKQAEICLELKLYAKAVTLAEEVSAIESGFFEVYLIKGHAYTNEKKYGKAEAQFEKALQNGADLVDVHLGKAENFIAQKHYEEALESLKIVLAEDPDTTNTCNRFIEMACQANKKEEAAEYVSKLISDKDPYNIKYWKVLAELYAECQCYEKAIEANDYVLAIVPNEEEALINKFHCLNHIDYQGDLLDFYEALEPIVQEEEEHISVLLKMGARYELDMENEKAEECYKKLLFYGIEKNYALYKLGVLNNKMYQIETAVYYLNLAIEGDDASTPLDKEVKASAYHWLARSCSFVEQEEQAQENEKKAIDLDPDQKEYLYTYVLYLYTFGNIEKAKEYIEERLSHSTSHAPSLLMYGAIWYYMEKKEEALSWFAKAFMTDKDTIKDADKYLADIMEDPKLEKLVDSID
ncbi:MAG: tetratricopeptide repeat protein [Bacteroidales bacterium]